MPIAAYYHGHGAAVMADMKQRYGKRAKAVFYATAQKRHQTPPTLVDARRSDKKKA